jgi:hypothetical protein
MRPHTCRPTNLTDTDGTKRQATTALQYKAGGDSTSGQMQAQATIAQSSLNAQLGGWANIYDNDHSRTM